MYFAPMYGLSNHYGPIQAIISWFRKVSKSGGTNKKKGG